MSEICDSRGEMLNAQNIPFLYENQLNLCVDVKRDFSFCLLAHATIAYTKKIILFDDDGQGSFICA